MCTTGVKYRPQLPDSDTYYADMVPADYLVYGYYSTWYFARDGGSPRHSRLDYWIDAMN